MSEMESAPVESAPVESAPTDTASIAEQTLDTLESSESTPVETAAPAEAPPELSEEELLLREFGFMELKKPDGRDHYIPRPKVLNMIASGLKRGREKWASERTPLETEIASYKERWGRIDPILSLLDKGPEAFLAEASKHDQRFAEFMAARQQAQAPQAQQTPDFPAPDLPLPDGSRTYTVEGLQKNVFPWMLEQARALAKQEAESALKPFAETQKQAAERAQREQAETQIREKTQSQLKEAQSWPHFGKLAEDGTLTEFQTAVLKELQADPKVSFEGAYIKAVAGKLSEDDKTKRAQLLKEVNAAAKSSPSVPRAAAETPGNRPASTRDMAAKALERLERGA